MLFRLLIVTAFVLSAAFSLSTDVAKPATSLSSRSVDDGVRGSNLVTGTSNNTHGAGTKEDEREKKQFRSDYIPNLDDIEHLTEIKYIAECELPSVLGDFKMRSYTYLNKKTGLQLQPIVVYNGDVRGKENVIVRIHDQCFTSEVFGSLRCDCREQLQESLRLVNEQGGIVIYLQQEGRGIGLPNKIAAYSLQDHGMDTVEANVHLGFEDEMREYNAIPGILEDMKVQSIRIVTNNPFKIEQVVKLGVKVNERISIEIPCNQHNHRYLKIKKDKMRHMFNTDYDHDHHHHGELGDHHRRHSHDDLINDHTTDHDHVSDEAKELMDSIPKASIISIKEKDNLSNDKFKTIRVKIDNVHFDPTYGHFKGYTKSLGKQSALDAIEAVKQGEIVLVVDDESRENEGDLIMAAEKATPEKIGFMVRYSSGVLCAAMERHRLEELKLPPMVRNNQDPKQTSYTISVDWKKGTSTGISAHDRAATFRGLADPKSVADDFYRPGHVFPLRYKSGGVLARGGHTEASVDLCKLAGLQACAVLCEVVHDDGSMQRLPDLVKYGKEHNLVLTSIQDLAAYRYEMEKIDEGK